MGVFKMSEYGIKIKNYEAASLYECYWGFRQYPDTENAMLSNSLFKDFLVESGMEIKKDGSSRDIICLAFSYKTKGYKELTALIPKIFPEDKVEEMLANVEKNKDKCIEIKKERLREIMYEDGVTIRYKDTEIHYKMLYRTPGKAKKGTCMFIRDSLYDKAHEFLTMGIKLPDTNAPIIQLGAYQSLITSGMVGTIEIDPDQILVLNDIDSTMIAPAITVELDKNKHCIAKKRNSYELKNCIFDGQALIDSSIFPEWADGYVLLRNHMTKCAAFNTNIELFMREHFGSQYETATIKDMFGREVKVSNIKLICTESIIKWTKFNITFDYWASWVRKNHNKWGIVKTTHASKLGDVQRMSYQMINALDLETMPEVTARSVNYIDKLKKDNKVFLDYLRKNVNFANDYDVLVALTEHNPDFVNSSYFRDRKRKIIESYVSTFKSGEVVQNADNLTIVGSPYAMLLHAIGENVENDETFNVENNAIQCWCEKFRDKEYLAAFRSPFNSRNNLDFLHNKYHPYFDRYFKFGRLCIAVNMIHTCMQERSNGSDQDSDQFYTTNQPDIVEHARKCYRDYPTIVNLIPQEKNKYNNTPLDYAKVDNILAASQLAIGESSNLAQLSLTYTYNFDEQKYQDAVCILAIIAQVAIDSAKKKFDLDIPDEIRYIKSQLDIAQNGLPTFWLSVKKDTRKSRSIEQTKKRRKETKERLEKKINPNLVCPMNYMSNLRFNKYRSDIATIPIEKFLQPCQNKESRRRSEKIEKLIEKYAIDLNEFEISQTGQYGMWFSDRCILLMDNFEELIKDIRKTGIPQNYAGLMYWLINRAFRIPEQTKNSKSKLDANKPILLKTLYEVNPQAFLSCFVQRNKN